MSNVILFEFEKQFENLEKKKFMKIYLPFVWNKNKN